MSEGGELVYLVSAPRSGSTLLQHMLGSHSEILTAPEPWFLLHFAYTLRESGMSAEYRSDYVSLAFRQFLASVPDGEAVYKEALAEMVSRVYRAALEPTGKSLFLDKTPRYYLILSELADLFPRARFVLLVRNPVAIFTSLLKVSLADDWTRFRSISRWHDLMSAPRLLATGADRLGDRAIVVRYEDLVADSGSTLSAVCDHIGVSFEPSMLDYSGVRFEGTSFIDSKSIYRHTGPVQDYAEAWRIDVMQEPERSFARAYIEELGPNVVTSLGYDYAEIEQLLAGRKAIGLRLRLWRRIIAAPPRGAPEWGASSQWERSVLRMLAILRRGFWVRVSRRVRASH